MPLISLSIEYRRLEVDSIGWSMVLLLEIGCEKKTDSRKGQAVMEGWKRLTSLRNCW
jgi:hypothetical protein